MNKDNLIVCIGRENGSGGLHIAKLVSERLGIPYYDEEKIQQLSKEKGLPIDYVKKHDERRPKNPLYFAGQTVPTKLIKMQADLIREVASKESCVIVGHCADYILRDFNKVVKVFIHAPLEARIERVARREGISEKEAAKRIKISEKERAEYYQFCTQQKWADCRNFHVTVDVTTIGMENVVNLIEEFVLHQSESHKIEDV